MKRYVILSCLMLLQGIMGFQNIDSTKGDSGKNQETQNEDGNQADWHDDVDLDMNTIYDSIWENLQIDAYDQALNQEVSFSVKQMVTSIIQEDRQAMWKILFQQLEAGISQEILQNKRMMIELIGVVLIGSIFVNLSSSFAGGFISENGFYITYMIMTSILLSSFVLSITIVIAAVKKILTSMSFLIPMYFVALQYVGYVRTAQGLYVIFLVSMWLVQLVILNVLIPVTQFYVVLSLVNQLQKEDSFSKLCELLKSLVSWLLRSMIVVIIGLNLIKGLLEPQMDALGRGTLKRVVNLIPSGVPSMLATTFLGAGMVVKNSIGVVGILLLGGICLLPILKMFLLLFSVKLTNAMIQPLGEPRYVAGLQALSQGISMLMQILGCSVVVFMLTIAMMACVHVGG